MRKSWILSVLKIRNGWGDLFRMHGVLFVWTGVGLLCSAAIGLERACRGNVTCTIYIILRFQRNGNDLTICY